VVVGLDRRDDDRSADLLPLEALDLNPALVLRHVASPACMLGIACIAGAGSPVLRLPTSPPPRALRVPILTYHRVDLLRSSLAPITRRLTVDPNEFASQMTWLHAHRWHALSQRQLFAALEEGKQLPPRPVVITFDDGYRDVLGKAAPVLVRLHLRATAYVITARISGPDRSFLTWGMLRALERRGVEIGSHTVHHAALPSLPQGEALRELRDSRAVLERHLGHPVQWFSYPFGAYDSRTVPLVRRAGYVLAVTTRPGALQYPRQPLTLRRYEVLDTTTTEGFAAMLGRPR
jgi:peptidoglycan/xylan/chitin deacetylase (PgdA/CDA1 family)